MGENISETDDVRSVDLDSLKYRMKSRVSSSGAILYLKALNDKIESVTSDDLNLSRRAHHSRNKKRLMRFQATLHHPYRVLSAIVMTYTGNNFTDLAMANRSTTDSTDSAKSKFDDNPITLEQFRDMLHRFPNSCFDRENVINLFQMESRNVSSELAKVSSSFK